MNYTISIEKKLCKLSVFVDKIFVTPSLLETNFGRKNPKKRTCLPKFTKSHDRVIHLNNKLDVKWIKSFRDYRTEWI
ncbi:MAG: hypothetical protein Harvfovirus16_8 [Harvfovirus sp.]|uniref:Uncharacterized protein n=1 Tax=Harvfovirus sp. TaxID=2487768 RepID=A0A3G5A1K8_9VIRU|nr:MAG: hypothetical protein Harvfovirus16_8 [Harvfovirus sp.]